MSNKENNYKFSSKDHSKNDHKKDHKSDKKIDKKQVFDFDVEVGKILQLMINSLYTNKDVALRELIANGSDACDKMRYLASQNSQLSADELKLTITTNKKEKLLIITDNGIGMNREDLLQNLGTIAKSGTESFVKSLTGDKQKDVQLIGQFGVGFYSFTIGTLSSILVALAI